MEEVPTESIPLDPLLAGASVSAADPVVVDTHQLSGGRSGRRGSAGARAGDGKREYDFPPISCFTRTTSSRRTT